MSKNVVYTSFMTRIESPSFEPTPHFTELESIPLWSATTPVNLSCADFEQAMRHAVEDGTQSYTGFFTRDLDTVLNFTSTRYPRAKYGIPSTEACNTAMSNLSEILGHGHVRNNTINGDIRILIGLVEGYNDTLPTHTIDEIHAIAPQLGITPAEVFAIMNTESGISIYTEPVAVIEASLDQIDVIYSIAHAFRQERFAVENFTQRIVYVVETAFCSDPD